jgi:hypothetical protein
LLLTGHFTNYWKVTGVTGRPVEQTGWHGCLISMRISALVCTSLVLVTIAAGQVAAFEQPDSFSQAAEVFLPQAEYPLLFVGQIVEADSGPADCKVTDSRKITYSVSTVLYGFAPPSQVKVAFPGCTKSEAPPSYKGDVLVLAMFYGPDLCGSRKELVLPATPMNLQRAQSLLNADLKKRISRYMRHHGPPHNNRVVVFEGTARDPVPHSQQPLTCKEEGLVPINYDVEQVLHGDWTDKRMVVQFGACFNLPDPPIRVGQRMIVFAYVSRSQVYGFLDLLFAPEQMPQVKAALASR